MEGILGGILGALVFLAIVACCGFPIIILAVARLFKGNKSQEAAIPSAQQERMPEINDLDRPRLDRGSK